MGRAEASGRQDGGSESAQLIEKARCVDEKSILLLLRRPLILLRWALILLRRILLLLRGPADDAKAERVR
jgi:hypothetical protein